MSNFSSVSPEEAKAVWDSLTNPSLNGVHKALLAAGRKVSLQTIANWKAAGWSRKQVPLSAEDQLQRAIPALTGDPTTKLADLVNSRPELLALSPAELDALRIQTTAAAEVAVGQYLAERVEKLDPKQISDLMTALARATPANSANAKALPERARDITPPGTEIPPWVRTRGGVVERWEDDPLHDAIEAIGGPLPDAAAPDPYWGEKYGRTPEQVKAAYEEARRFDETMRSMRMAAAGKKANS